MADDTAPGPGSEDPQFRYEPLDPSKRQIRVLIPLQPGDGVPARNDVDNETRLLGIYANLVVRPDLTLHFSLRIITLSARTSSPEESKEDRGSSYTALSYVWGDPMPVCPIVVDGTPFLVTRNLHSALHHLCHADVAPAIWIDSVCINQSDVAEKESQVSMMGYVYRGARRVIVWLGEGGGEELEHAKLIRDVTYSLLFQKLTTLATRRADGYLEDKGERALREAAASQIARGLSPFAVLRRTVRYVFGRRWWYRVWVIQEFVLANECSLQLGRARFNVDDCARFLDVAGIYLASINTQIDSFTDPETVEMMSILSDTWLRKMLDMKDALSRQREAESRTLFNTLCRAHCRLAIYPILSPAASDRRDYIYALVGLCADDYERALGLRIDYSKTWQAVYVETATALISSGNLSLLSLCHRPDQLTDWSLPSWSPRWHAEVGPPHLAFLNTDGPKVSYGNFIYSTSGTSTAKVDFSKLELRNRSAGSSRQMHVMHLAGTAFDYIAEVASTPSPSGPERLDPLTTNTPGWGYLRDIQSLCKRAERWAGPAAAQDPLAVASTLPDAVWRIPVRDINPADSLSGPWPGPRRCASAVRVQFKVASYLIEGIHEIACLRRSAGSRDWWLHWLRGTWYYVLFITRLAWVILSYIFFEGPKVSTAEILTYPGLVIGSPPSRAFISTRGLVGLGPANVESGDKIVVFYGSRVPHLLRRVEGPGGEMVYRLVGDAYVHGIMHGEFMATEPETEIFNVY